MKLRVFFEHERQPFTVKYDDCLTSLKKLNYGLCTLCHTAEFSKNGVLPARLTFSKAILFRLTLYFV